MPSPTAIRLKQLTLFQSEYPYLRMLCYMDPLDLATVASTDELNHLEMIGKLIVERKRRNNPQFGWRPAREPKIR